MKKKMLTTVFALAVVLGTSATTNPIKKTVKVESSTITWVGKKVLGQHTGTIALKDGVIEMEDGKLVGGNFTVDMSTITVTDLEAGKGKEKLEGHLNSEDFFGVEAHPTATFVITDVAQSGDGYSVVGDLTVKGITESIKVKMNASDTSASTTFMVDRTKFGIKYGSASFIDGLKDKAINDEFELTVNLNY